MKKVIILIVTLFVTLSGYSQIPNSFTLNEEVISIGTCFEMSGVNGVINEKVISMTASFKLYINDVLTGSSKQRYFSWGSKVDIFDGKGNKIGLVEEQVFESMFSPLETIYKIYDGSGRLVASSIKHELMVTKFQIKDTNGNVCCTIKRPAINVMGDKWSVEFSKTNKLNKLLFVFIPCYKTYRDNLDE